MRELVKSIISASLGLGLLAAREGSRMLASEKPDEAFRETGHILDDASITTQAAMGPELRKVFDYGDEMQRRMIDAGMGAVNSDLFNPARYMKMGSEVFRRAALMFSQPSDR